MPPLTPAAFRKHLQARRLEPLYLLIGDDHAEKGQLTGVIANAVDPELHAFNVERLYGGETSVGAVLDAARTLPLMSDRRVVIVLQAEKLLEARRESEAAARALEDLEAYVQAPARDTSLVLVADQLDLRRRLAKLLLARAVVVECGGIESIQDAERWVRATTGAAGVQIHQAAVSLLVDRAGADLGRLRSEVERVLLYAAGRARVELNDVQQVVGSAAAPEDEWAVTKAIGRGHTAAALRELARALDAGAVPYAVLGQLGWFIRTKLQPSRVADAVERLFETDLALKTSGGDPRALLERLVIELCAGTGEAGGRAARLSRRG